jgi:hypothetical protein
MSETNKANTVAFHTKAIFEGDVESAFRLYGGTPYRQHNPLIGDGMEGLRKFVAVGRSFSTACRAAGSRPAPPASRWAMIAPRMRGSQNLVM